MSLQIENTGYSQNEVTDEELEELINKYGKELNDAINKRVEEIELTDEEIAMLNEKDTKRRAEMYIKIHGEPLCE